MTNGDAGDGAQRSAADKARSDLLAQEQFVAEILKLRKPKDHWWNSSPLLTGLVAIVSIVLSSVATVQTQRAAKATEFTVAQRSELFTERRKFLYDLAAMLAVVDKTSEDRLLFARGVYDSLPASEQLSIRDSVNAVDDRWHIAAKANEVLLLGLYEDSTGIPAHWRLARDSLQAYVRCTEETYKKYQGRHDLSATSCSDQRTRADSAISRFLNLLLMQTDRGVR